MSPELVTCLVAVAANLAGMVLIHSVMSCAFARRSGLVAIVALIVSQLFWIVPALWIVETQGAGRAGSYALWFGNWLVSGFSIVVFRKSTAKIPAALNDMVRMDGLGGFAAWRQAVLPFVRRDLFILAAFTLMATLVPFWGCLTLPEAGSSIVLFQRFLSTSGRLAFMAALSMLGAVPLIAIFLLVSRRSLASPLPPLVRG
jgi:ABC-type glycerol-3-phosphate transport system permease component